MVNYKKNIFLSVSEFVSLKVPIKEKGKKRFFKMEHWRTSKKPKYLIASAIIAVLLISIFAFFPKKSVTEANVPPQGTESETSSPPTPKSAPPEPKEESDTDYLSGFLGSVFRDVILRKEPGLIASAKTINSTIWMKVAAIAWAFYQPNVGVDPNTGLPFSTGFRFSGFTDWDLGSYIQAVIVAQKIGLIDTNGTWGSYARFDRVLTFLENRPLNAYSYPFQFYDARNGREYYPDSNASTKIVDIADTGKLLVALNNLRYFNDAFAPRINTIVLGGRSNYTAVAANISKNADLRDIYGYYVYSGFASFWPQQLEGVPSAIIDYILNSQNITAYGVTLPLSNICIEPLLGSIFELDNDDSAKLMGLATQVYFACEAYYNSTGEFVAPSEGSNGNEWLYEWVVAPNGEAWRIMDTSGNYRDMDFIVYNKVAFGFLALFNTDFARDMVIWLEDALPNPTNGYHDGADNRGGTYAYISDLTNALILETALYALQKG
jgi:hypothetical protein